MRRLETFRHVLALALPAALTAACAAAPPVDEQADEQTGPPPDLAALVALGIDPDTTRCVPMDPEAAVAEPPPPEPSDDAADDGQDRADRTPVPDVCPHGFVPEYGREPRVEQREGLGTVSSGLSCPIGKYWYAGARQSRNSSNGYGVGATLSIHDRPLYAECDQVTGQISVVKGNNDSVVELGWRRFYDPYPKLLIGHWRNGAFRDAEGFRYTHATYRNNMNIASMAGTKRRFVIRLYAGNWWVWFNDAWVGYFPGSLWSGTFSRADVHHWYGEVLSAWNVTPPRTDMGSGYPASDSRAATMSSMCTMNSSGSCGVHSSSYGQTVTNVSYYSLLQTSSSSFRYGGNGGG